MRDIKQAWWSNYDEDHWCSQEEPAQMEERSTVWTILGKILLGLLLLACAATIITGAAALLWLGLKKVMGG